MIHRTVEMQFQFEVEELAREFSLFNSDDQAIFFSELAKIAEDMRPAAFVGQLQAISDSKYLTAAGRRMMAQIGEYAEAANDV